jgi:hypothetical protein
MHIYIHIYIYMHINTHTHTHTHTHSDASCNSDSGLRTAYLERVIRTGETEAQYHNELVLLYLDAVQRLKQA